MDPETAEGNKNQNYQLCIDHVASSQPGLGPKIPDGGYGWIILLASSFFQILIPSLPVGFGIITLYIRLENGMSTNPTLWDVNVVYVAVLFISVWTLTEPWCRKIVSDSTWPRLVSLAATCLTSAGLLIMWIGINNRKSKILFIIAGSVSGFGASLILTQTNVIVSQYFYLKLQKVKTLLSILTALGFVITPMLLGHYILRIGILQTVSWYQAVILQGIIISLVFKKPEYLKQHRSRYNLLKGIADEDEDIFTKNSTELQSPRRTPLHNSSTVDVNVKNVSQSQSLQEELRQAGWDKFNEDTNTTSSIHSKLNVAFGVEFNNGIKNNNKDDHFEDNYTEIPEQLFNESYLNNNVSYSYESSPVEVDNPVVFMPISSFPTGNKWKVDLHFFKEPTFYKTLLLLITQRFTILLFWTLFPSYLYLKVDHLKIHEASTGVGCVGIGGAIVSLVTSWIKLSTNIRILFVSIFCWTSAAGCLMVAESTTELLLIFAAVFIIINIVSLQTLAAPLMKFNFPGEQSSGYLFLSIGTAACLIASLGIEISYQKCFWLLGTLQLITGSLCFTNLLYKGIKKYMSFH